MESGWSIQNILPAPDRLGRVGAPHWIAWIGLVEAALRYPMERAFEHRCEAGWNDKRSGV